MKNTLLSQAVRVHLARKRQGTQNAKTRAEISRTRHKLYKQKGTGGARHGDRKAPIFVGGGVAFAPKPRDYALKLPLKMRQKALELALKLKKPEKVTLTKVTGKTKDLLKLITVEGKTLLITKDYHPKVWQAGRNIANLTVLPKHQLNAYEVLKAEKIYAE